MVRGDPAVLVGQAAVSVAISEGRAALAIASPRLSTVGSACAGATGVFPTAGTGMVAVSGAAVPSGSAGVVGDVGGKTAGSALAIAASGSRAVGCALGAFVGADLLLGCRLAGGCRKRCGADRPALRAARIFRQGLLMVRASRVIPASRRPARGWRLAGRVSAGVSVFVGGARDAGRVWRGRERSAYRGPRTLTGAAHAGRDTLVATATAHGLAGRLRRPSQESSHIMRHEKTHETRRFIARARTFR